MRGPACPVRGPFSSFSMYIARKTAGAGVIDHGLDILLLMLIISYKQEFIGKMISVLPQSFAAPELFNKETMPC